MTNIISYIGIIIYHILSFIILMITGYMDYSIILLFNIIIRWIASFNRGVFVSFTSRGWLSLIFSNKRWCRKTTFNLWSKCFIYSISIQQSSFRRRKGIFQGATQCISQIIEIAELIPDWDSTLINKKRTINGDCSYGPLGPMINKWAANAFVLNLYTIYYVKIKNYLYLFKYRFFYIINIALYI